MGRWCVLTGGLPGAGVGELVAVAPLRGSKDATDAAWRSVLTDFVPTYVTQSGSTWVLAASVPGACDGLAWRTASLGGTPIALAVLVAAPARPADEACNAIAERLAR